MIKVENLEIMSHRTGWFEFTLTSDTQLPIEVKVSERDRDNKGKFPALEPCMYGTMIDHGLPIEEEWEEKPNAENLKAIEKVINTLTKLCEKYPHRLGVERHLRFHPELLVF